MTSNSLPLCSSRGEFLPTSTRFDHVTYLGQWDIDTYDISRRLISDSSIEPKLVS